MSSIDSSLTSVEKLAEHAAELAVALAWQQWSQLNPAAIRPSNAAPMRSIIDPEVLVLATGCLWRREPRLLDVMAGWAKLGSKLLSVQRVRTLLKDEQSWGPDAAAPFAQLAIISGDQRWKALLPAQGVELAARRGKGPDNLHLDAVTAVLLRIRAAFGVSSKADVFTYLLSLQGEARSAADIAEAVAFSSKIAREAADDLVLGGLAEAVTDGYPVRYAVRRGFAPTFLALIYSPRSPDFIPRWRNWSQVYGLLLDVSRWPERVKGKAGPLALGMWAREAFERHRGAFRDLDREDGIDVPDPRLHPGAGYLQPFRETLRIAGTRLT